jgi:hypothetical protein
MLLLQPLNLMALEGKERGFQAREERRAENQNDNRTEKDDKTGCRHPSLSERDSRTLAWKKNRPRLPVISADSKLNFK